MGRQRGTAEARAARNQQYHGRMTNEERSALRVGQHAHNWQPLVISDFARGLGLRINFAGFWTTSDNGMKVEGTDPTSGYTFIMDSTRVYYRVQNSAGQYVDASGRTRTDAPYNGNDDAFMAASHFKNSRS